MADAAGHGRRVWWLNGRARVDPATHGAYLWVPVDPDTRSTPPHFIAVGSVTPGDVVIQCDGGQVVAVGVVVQPPEQAPCPEPTSRGGHAPSGLLARLDSRALAAPLGVAEIVCRTPGVGPFDEESGVRRGFLLPVPEPLGEHLVAEVEGRAGATAGVQATVMVEGPSFGGSPSD